MVKPEKKPVTPATVLEISDMSGLGVDSDGAADLAAQVQSMRDSINAMDEVDLTDVEPATIYPLKPLGR